MTRNQILRRTSSRWSYEEKPCARTVNVGASTVPLKPYKRAWNGFAFCEAEDGVSMAVDVATT